MMRVAFVLLVSLLGLVGLANPPALDPLSQPFGRDPLRDYIRIPPGRYLVTGPIVIDPGLAFVGGQARYTRGWGPTIDLRGVVFVVSPAFVGDRVLDVVGCKPIIEGGTIDSRWKAVENGAVWRAKVHPLTGRPEASGGRGAWRNGGILGVFTKAALAVSSAEEITFEMNIVSQGPGAAVILENGREYGPAWSQTMVVFAGSSIQAYGGDAFLIRGDVNDVAIRDSFLASPMAAVNATAATGKRNRLDGVRFECGRASAIIRGTAGWSRGSTVLSVSPIVDAWQAREPLPANTMSQADLIRGS